MVAMQQIESEHRLFPVRILDLFVRYTLENSCTLESWRQNLMQLSTFGKFLSVLIGATFLGVGLVACDSQTGDPPAGTSLAMHLDVYKSPSCTCCKKWIDGLDPQEFKVSVHDRIHMGSTKVRYNIAPEYQSCHTAISESGHYFEGHIPAKFVKQFLSDPPDDAVGLAVPGMPIGSPGMESGDRFTPYEVLQIHKDGSSTIFASIDTPQDHFE